EPEEPEELEELEELEEPEELEQEEEQQYEDQVEEFEGQHELSSPKPGIALYDFDAQGDDEISISEGDKLWIIDDFSSKYWWKCRRGTEEGVVPSSYIEVS